MNLIQWVERLRIVDSETAHHIKRIKLCSVDGMVWETWEAPFPPTTDELVKQITTVTDALKEEWPTKVIQVLLVAEDGEGTTHSQCPLSVRGVNKSANAAIFNGESRAQAEAMDSIARTVERLLATANTQLSLMAKHTETVQDKYHQALNYIQESNENKALTAQAESDTTRDLQKHLIQALPTVLAMLSKATGNSPQLAKTLNGAQKVAEVVSHVAHVANAEPQSPPTTEH